MDRAGVFRFLCRERILTPLRARSQAHVTNHTTLTVYNSSLLWLQWDPQTLHILLPSNWATTSAPSRVELSRCHSYSVTSAFPTFTGVRLYLAQHQQNVIWPITELHEGVALKWHAGPSGSTGSEYKQGHPLPFPGRTLSIIPCLLPASLKFLSASVTGQLRALLTLFRNGPLFTVGQFRSLGFMTASQCLESGRAQACLPVPLTYQGCGARTLRAANSEREMGGEGWGGAPLEGKGREQDWAEAPRRPGATVTCRRRQSGVGSLRPVAAPGPPGRDGQSPEALSERFLLTAPSAPRWGLPSLHSARHKAQ